MNTFLRLWFAKFEEFQDNDFFVAGESYAGVYVPLVSQVSGSFARNVKKPRTCFFFSLVLKAQPALLCLLGPRPNPAHGRR